MNEQPLLNAIDLEILMHKDAHFGGSFPIMIEYYENDGVGVQEDFDIQRIKQLQNFDAEGHLASDILPEMAKNDVLFSKSLYEKFKKCYENDAELPKKIADLILTESENPEEEINAMGAFSKECLPGLSEILQQDHFYNPLNPGYGKAPLHACEAMKFIEPSLAMPILFQSLGKSFSTDEAILRTMTHYGESAETFLQERLQGEPFTKDNYLAAMALASFPITDESARLALGILQQPSCYKHSSYVSYLICICEALENNSDRETFLELTKNETLSSKIKDEMTTIISFWQN